jgi:hypothetical protein
MQYTKSISNVTLQSRVHKLQPGNGTRQMSSSPVLMQGIMMSNYKKQNKNKKNQTNSQAFSPQANYTD